MNLELRLVFAWICAGSCLLLACSKKDEGVTSRSNGAVGGRNGDQGDDGDDGDDPTDEGSKPDDAGFADPADAEVVTIDLPDATCAATVQQAKQVTTTKETVVEVPKEEIKPVAIYLMLDRSSSMVGVCTNGGCNPQSWTQATQAITAFVSDPASAELDVALGYFPPTVAEANLTLSGPLCTGVSCGKAAVPIDKAGRNAVKINDSLNGAVPPSAFPGPFNYTPTECAIRGMSAFCKEHKQRTGQKCVGVIITDGFPQRAPNEECSIDETNLVNVTTVAAMEGTPVFTLGLTGAKFDFLDRVATAGGTDCRPADMMHSSCDATSGKDAFVAALNAIRETVVVKETRIETETIVSEVPIDCEWTIPPPPMDQQFDKGKVNVSFMATDVPARTIGHVKSMGECEMFPDGWYFDNPETPSKVLACSKACAEIKAAKGAKISIELGCKTMVLE